MLKKGNSMQLNEPVSIKACVNLMLGSTILALSLVFLILFVLKLFI